MSTLAEELWTRLAERIGKRLGLSFPPQRVGELRRALARAAPELGFRDADECAARLVADPWDRQRLDILAAQLTVGETYFFRDPALFDALAGSVLPAIVRHGERRSRRLRIWSAGCCTGEEPYSLAIVASQVMARFPGGSVEIRATDVNPRFLQRAAAAAYGAWSFRGMPAGYLARYFVALDEGRYAPRPEIRGFVTFAQDNLVDGGEAGCAADTDLIVCRNVLMYFTPEQMRHTIRRLHDALAPGGWLVVSPSEAAAQRFPEFAPVMRGGAFFYRKKGPLPVEAPAREPASVAPPLPSAPVAAPIEPAQSPRPASPASRELAPDVAGLAVRAKDCADRGALDEALRWCDRWLAASRLDPAAHYLQAMVLLERDERAAARVALTRALYLDPGHVMSHVARGNLARAEGCEGEARRCFRNALHLVQPMRADDPVADADTMSAGALREALAALLEALHPA